MKTEIYSKCIELHKIVLHAFSVRNEIEKLHAEYIKANRKFADGETVMVCNAITHKEIGRGMVASASTYLHLDFMRLKDYADIKKFNNDIDCMCYEIYAIKADGTMSSKHFVQAPHFMTDNIDKWTDYYIKKL